MLLIIIILPLILILLILAIFIIPTISNWIENNRSKIEGIYIMASIVTILALFATLWIYDIEKAEQERFENKNKMKILEGLDKETELNLQLIGKIKLAEEEYRNGSKATVRLYDTTYLRKAFDVIEDINFRYDIIDTYIIIEDTNRLMDIISRTENPTYVIKNYDTIYEQSQIIRNKLCHINEYVKKLTNKTLKNIIIVSDKPGEINLCIY